MSLQLSVAVLTLSVLSLTNTIAVLLSHEVCTAMIHTHKCGLDRTPSRARRPIYSNLHRDLKRKESKMSLPAQKKNSLYLTRPITVSFAQKRSHVSPLQDKNLPARCSRRSDCTHKLAPSHARPATGPHRPAPPKGRGPAVRVTAAMYPREPMVSSPKA